MQLSSRYGFAFLCMPKCASTSIEDAINRYCNINFTGHPFLKHLSARDFHHHIMSYYQRMFPDQRIETFCLMREPFEWVHSWYRFRCREELKDPSNPSHRNYAGHLTFAQFVDCFDQAPLPNCVAFGTQSEFVTLDDGSLGVDRIFPMTCLNQVPLYLTEKIGKPIRLPRRNVSPDMQLDVPASVRDKVYRHFEQDLKLYEQVVKSIEPISEDDPRLKALEPPAAPAPPTKWHRAVNRLRRAGRALLGR